MKDKMTFFKGYDWLCRCGDSNYEDEKDCIGCGGPRNEKEINYLTTLYTDEKEDYGWVL